MGVGRETGSPPKLGLLARVSGIMFGMTAITIRSVAFVALVLSAALLGSGCAASIPHPMIGHLAPDVLAEPIGGEGPKSLKEARGKVVVLDFWATWCKPCQASFPGYARLAGEFRADVVFMAVSIDDPGDVTEGKILDFARKAGATFPIFWDKDGSASATYGGSKGLGLPSTFIIDRAGTIRRLHQGYGPYHVATIERELKELLAEGVPPSTQEAASIWTPRSLSCKTVLQQEPQARQAIVSGCKDDACRRALTRQLDCKVCLLASCCAEETACNAASYPPASVARAAAAACACRASVRVHGHSDVETRCGPPNDLSRAETACAAAHCSDACAQPPGGPPP